MNLVLFHPMSSAPNNGEIDDYSDEYHRTHGSVRQLLDHSASLLESLERVRALFKA